MRSSLLLRSATRQQASSPFLFRSATLPRSFTTTRNLTLKENKEQDPQVLEKAKQQQGNSKDAREELESQSESNVQADKQKVEDHDSHIEKLQDQTARKQQEDHPEGK